MHLGGQVKILIPSRCLQILPTDWSILFLFTGMPSKLRARRAREARLKSQAGPRLEGNCSRPALLNRRDAQIAAIASLDSRNDNSMVNICIQMKITNMSVRLMRMMHAHIKRSYYVRANMPRIGIPNFWSMKANSQKIITSLSIRHFLGSNLGAARPVSRIRPEEGNTTRTHKLQSTTKETIK